MAAEKEEAPAKPAIKVLMVDDDESEYAIIRPMLFGSKVFDYRLEWGAGYRDGYGKMISNNYAVCLLDYNLGMETGLELMRSARRDGCKIPIILLTGTTDENVDYLVMKEGAEDYLRKDEITAQTLERAIRYTILRHKLQAELLSARDEKMQFISFIANDLRAPLHNILSASAEADRDGNYGGHLLEAAQIAEYMLEQVEDILDINKLSKAADQEVTGIVFNVPQVIDKAVFFVKSFAEKNDVKIITTMQDRLPELKADRRKVRQMLINLLYHALKYGGALKKITVSAYMEGLNLVLEVKDEGVGMSPHEVKRLLKPYEKGKSPAGGTGLGLPLAQHYIEEHGGQLEIKSQPARGTTARLIFPSERVMRVKNSIFEAERKAIREDPAKRPAVGS